jgi:hypothetical protein
MANFISTRNANQCRTYTSKLIIRFDGIVQILVFFKQSLPLYQKFIDQQRHKLINIFFNED